MLSEVYASDQLCKTCTSAITIRFTVQVFEGPGSKSMRKIASQFYFLQSGVHKPGVVMCFLRQHILQVKDVSKMNGTTGFYE